MTSWEIDVDFVDFSIRSFPRFRRFGAKLRLRWCPWRFESHQQGSQLDITGSLLFYIFSTVSAMKELNYIHFSLKALTKEDKETKGYLKALMRFTFCKVFVHGQTSPVLTAPADPFTLADMLTLSALLCVFECKLLRRFREMVISFHENHFTINFIQCGAESSGPWGGLSQAAKLLRSDINRWPVKAPKNGKLENVKKCRMNPWNLVGT